MLLSFQSKEPMPGDEAFRSNAAAPAAGFVVLRVPSLRPFWLAIIISSFIES